MTGISYTDDIVKHFLNSDSKIWINEQVTGLKRKACYQADMYIDELSDIYYFSVLIYQDSSSKDESLFKLNLSYGIKASINIPIGQISFPLTLTGDLSDISKAGWSGLDQPVIKKAWEISKVAPTVLKQTYSVS